MSESGESPTVPDEVPPEAASSGPDTCPECGGTGRVGGNECPACGGDGLVNEAVGGG